MSPENTHPAFEEALRQGADGIELDVQLTADETLVVYHDRTLHKVGGGRRRIAELTAAELRGRDFGRWFGPRFVGTAIPTLDEVLDRYGRRTRLMLELKTDVESTAARRAALVRRFVAALRKHRPREPFVLSFDPRALAAVGELDPRLRLVWNIDRRPRWTAATRRRVAPSHAVWSMHALCLPARLASVALADAVRSTGARLWVYRCDTPRSVSAAVRTAVEAMITDAPSATRALLTGSRSA